MKFYKKYFFTIDIVAAFLLFSSLFLLFFIPLRMNNTVWSAYRIVILSMDADEKAIMSYAAQNGITGIICSQSVDERFSKFIGGDFPFTDKESYVRWFLNDQENIRYMYIPKKHTVTNGLFNCIKSNSECFFIENDSEFSGFQFVLSFAFFIFALIFSTRKSVYFFAASPFIIYAALQSGILAFSATILMMYTIAFWTEAAGSYLKFTHGQLVLRIKKNPLLVFLPFVPVVISKFNSNTSFLLFIAAILSGICLTYISEKTRFFIIQNWETKNLHKKITPYAMNPRSIAKFWDTKKLIAVSAAAVFCIVFSALFLNIKFNKIVSAYKNRIYLPTVKHRVLQRGFSKAAFDDWERLRSGEDLPDLGNFILDSWNLKTLPHRKIQDRNERIDKIIFNDFTADENGYMLQTNTEIFSLNDDFIEKVISFRPSSCIEDLLYSEGRFITAVYSEKEFPLNRFNNAGLFVALLAALFPVTLILLRVFER